MELNLLLGTKCQAGCHLLPCQHSVLTLFSSFALTKFAADAHPLFEQEELTLILWKSTPNLLPTLLHFPAIFPLVTAHIPQLPPNPFIYHNLLNFLPQSLCAQRKIKSMTNVPSRKAEIKESPSLF